ncbi:MAG TPA: L-2-hydroxyglutarate oxidase [Nakamurella sp.]|nr:L-2-hydroxyglutarate oxidase [Nakamurella sp.]
MSVIVVGAGIVGLAVARQLLIERPDEPVTVLDKESRVAAHQTGHNSGVVHAGIYYQPGSLKAELCRRGRDLLGDFCAANEIAIDPVGKLVVALNEAERTPLAEIRRRALANRVTDVVMLDRDGLRKIEPEVAGIAALHSPSTAITDFVAVARALARDIETRGGTVCLNTELVGLRQQAGGVIASTNTGELRADRLVVCGGLQSARLATLIGGDPDPQIVPFRGEYFRLTPDAARRVRGLVYPVPDPRYPFLGIHLTRRIDGHVDVGPNAVLALALEGYRRRDVSWADARAVVGWPGFRLMARQHWRTGAREMFGSISKRYFAAQAREYLPGLTTRQLVPTAAGVRAQALRRDGQLVDDFWITHHDRITMVRNAPSPAATSSLAIAEHVCADLTRTGG